MTNKIQLNKKKGPISIEGLTLDRSHAVGTGITIGRYTQRISEKKAELENALEVDLANPESIAEARSKVRRNNHEYERLCAIVDESIHRLTNDLPRNCQGAILTNIHPYYQARQEYYQAYKMVNKLLSKISKMKEFEAPPVGNFTGGQRSSAGYDQW